MPSNDNEYYNNVANDCAIAAIIQGRLAYFLMSLHAPNPSFLTNLLHIDPYPFLFANIVYGIGVLLYTRPALRTIHPLHRFTFSALGSLMFSHGAVLYYHWLRNTFPERPFMVGFLGFLGGRVMLVHLYAYIYHVDTRHRYDGYRLRRISSYEGIFLGSLMFTSSTCHVYDWIHYCFPESKLFAVILGFLFGRIMMLHFVAFLYHMDTRVFFPGLIIPRSSGGFEVMYIVPTDIPTEVEAT